MSFEHIFDEAKKKHGAKQDTELTPAALKEVIIAYKKLVLHHTGAEFPQDPDRQLTMARDAVFQVLEQ